MLKNLTKMSVTLVHQLRTSPIRDSMKRTGYHFFIIHASHHIILVLLFITIFTPKSVTKQMECRPKPISKYNFFNDKFKYFWYGDVRNVEVVSTTYDKVELNCNDLNFKEQIDKDYYVPNPPVTVKWYKNGQILKEDSSKFRRFGCHLDPYYNGGRLDINNPRLSDTGLYQCKMFREDNTQFILEKSFIVLVVDKNKNSKPWYSSPPNASPKKDENTDERTLLNCAYKMSGTADVSFTWYWKGKKEKRKDHVLEVCEPGLYRCEVKNYLGGFNKTFQVRKDDLHCRSHLATLFLFACLVIGLVTLLFSIAHHYLKKTFAKNLFSEKALLKVHRHWIGYGMHTDVESGGKLDKDITVNSKPDPQKEKHGYCQPAVWSVTEQLKKNATISKKDFELVKQKEILRERVVCADKHGKTIELGSGFFGNVYKGFLTNDDGTKTPVAVKMLKNISNSVDFDHFMEEAATLIKSDGHQNVISLIGTCIFDALDSQKKPEASQKAPILIMELADGGNLHSYLVRCRDYCCEPCTSSQEVYSSAGNFNELVAICYQVALGMEHLTRKKILHRDLAARNILLTKEKEVKIGDFGLSKHLLLKDYYRICSRWEKPVKWTSPEALMFDKYTAWSDVWSFGVLMWEVFSLGAEPYEKMNPNNLYSHLQSGKRLPHPGLATDYLYKCMLSCWAWVPHRRKSFGRIIKELELILNKPKIKPTRAFSILDSNCSHINQENDPQPVQEKSPIPSLKLGNQCSLSSDESSIEQDTSEATAVSNTNLPDVQYSLWQNDTQYGNSNGYSVVEYPSRSSSESLYNTADSSESPYIAQIPNKPAFVFTKQNQPSLPNGPLLTRLPVFKDGLMFENQSYQSKKMRTTSLESPTDGDSDLSNPIENDFDPLKSEDNEWFYMKDAYFEVTI